MSDRLATLLDGEAGIAVLPRLHSLARSAGGDAWESVASDPSHLVPMMKRLAALFGSDALVFGDSSGLLPLMSGGNGEAVLAGTGRLDAAVEAVNRLADETGAAARVVILPGPIVTASRLGWSGGDFPESLKEILTAATERFCEARATLVLFDETGAAADILATMPARKIYNTLRNVASYFDVAIGAIIEGLDEDNSEVPAELKLDSLVIAAPSADALPDADTLAAMAEDVRLTGIAVPDKDLPTAAVIAQTAAAALSGKPLFFTTLASDGEGSIETMHELMRTLRGGD